MSFGFLEFRDLLDGEHLAIDTHADKALAFDSCEDLLMTSLLAANQWCEKNDLGAGFMREDLLDDLLSALLLDGLPAFRAMRLADAAVEQAQVIVDFRDRGDDGSWIAPGGSLLNGNSRGESLNVIDLRLLHLVKKLTGIR